MRFLLSLFAGLVVGLGIGLYLGWVQFPVEYVDSPASALDQRYRDEYTVMIANGYALDRDLQGALDRLRILGVENIATYVQDTTERYITNSRDVNDIRVLVTFAEGLGRLTPMMEPYREVSVPGQSS